MRSADNEGRHAIIFGPSISIGNVGAWTSRAILSGPRYRGGDCPAGCTQTTAYRFASEAPGVIERLETWQSPDGGGRGTGAPDWYALCNDF